MVLIPFFQIPPLQFLGLSIHAFEVLTSLGIYIGIRYTLNMAKNRNLSEKNVVDAIIVSIIAGFIGAHVMHVLLYQRDFSDPLKLFQIWKGISSTGGFLAGGVACWIFLRIKKLDIYAYGDCMVAGVLVALFFGRLGCFTAHDHPGSLTTFPLAVNFPGGARHDLGFYEAFFVADFLITAHVPAIRAWFNQKKGRWMVATLMFYGSIRLALDLLRAKDLPDADSRYFGLTPAQYACLIFITIAASILIQKRNVGNSRHS